MAQPDFSRIECVQGDLTLEVVDAIVNAASEDLRGGGGVDGAIHRAAGPGLLAELIERYPGGCPTGEACLSGGHSLPASHIVHTVGPIWRGGHQGEPELLASCYREALSVAVGAGCRSLSFPAVSCGVYGYPAAQAAEVAITALGRGLADLETIQQVRLVLFSAELYRVFGCTLEGKRG